MLKELTEEIEKVSKDYVSTYQIERDSNWYILKLQEEVGELTQAFLRLEGKAKKKGLTELEIMTNFSEELTDVFCHTLLLSKKYNIDLVQMTNKKWLSTIKSKR